MKQFVKAIVWVSGLTVLLLGVPRLAGTVASLFAYDWIDPDGAFAWLYVHHLAQAVVFLLIMLVLTRLTSLKFGFTWGDVDVGKRYVVLFTVIFGVGSVVTHLLSIVSGTFEPFPYPLTATNILGQLSFQLFMSGPSEELIFRAFAITMLFVVIKGRVLDGKVSVANILAAVIFGLAHVHFSLVPFETRYNPFQVILAFGLGIVYGDCYERTGSVYYPMILHSISNVIMVGLTIGATVII